MYTAILTTYIGWIRIYRFEFLVQSLRWFLSFGTVVLFWFVFAQHSTSMSSQWNILFAYLLFTQGVGRIVYIGYTNLGDELMSMISQGTFDMWLVRPVRIVWSVYMQVLGKNSMTFFGGVVAILLSFWFHPITALQVIYGCGVLLSALFIGFCLGVVEGVVGLVMYEGRGFSSVLRLVADIFSGMMIPIGLLPGAWQIFALWTPFPALAFAPAYIFGFAVGVVDTRLVLFSVVAWTSVLAISLPIIWSKVIRNYEAAGA